jgi:hypothetical protein
MCIQTKIERVIPALYNIQTSSKPSRKASTFRTLTTGVGSSFFSIGNPKIGPDWLTPTERNKGLRGETEIGSGVEDFLGVESDGAVTFDEDRTERPAEVPGGVAVEALAASDSTNAGSGAALTPHRPKTQPPTRPVNEGRLGFRVTVRSI